MDIDGSFRKSLQIAENPADPPPDCTATHTIVTGRTQARLLAIGPSCKSGETR